MSMQANTVLLPGDLLNFSYMTFVIGSQIYKTRFFIIVLHVTIVIFHANSHL